MNNKIRDGFLILSLIGFVCLTIAVTILNLGRNVNLNTKNINNDIENEKNEEINQDFFILNSRIEKIIENVSFEVFEKYKEKIETLTKDDYKINKFDINHIEQLMENIKKELIEGFLMIFNNEYGFNKEIYNFKKYEIIKKELKKKINNINLKEIIGWNFKQEKKEGNQIISKIEATGIFKNFEEKQNSITKKLFNFFKNFSTEQKKFFFSKKKNGKYNEFDSNIKFKINNFFSKLKKNENGNYNFDLFKKWIPNKIIKIKKIEINFESEKQIKEKIQLLKNNRFLKKLNDYEIKKKAIEKLKKQKQDLIIYNKKQKQYSLSGKLLDGINYYDEDLIFEERILFKEFIKLFVSEYIKDEDLQIIIKIIEHKEFNDKLIKTLFEKSNKVELINKQDGSSFVLTNEKKQIYFYNYLNEINKKIFLLNKTKILKFFFALKIKNLNIDFSSMKDLILNKIKDEKLNEYLNKNIKFNKKKDIIEIFPNIENIKLN